MSSKTSDTGSIPVAFTKLLGAGEACWAHNPKVGGSKPPVAISPYTETYKECQSQLVYMARISSFHLEEPGSSPGLGILLIR